MPKPPPEFNRHEKKDYQVRNEEVEQTLRQMAGLLKDAMPEGWGFTLMIFNYGGACDPDQGLFYLSSADRGDMIATMKEFIKKQEH